MNDVMTIRPASLNSLATSATRRMFSQRSSGEKPRSRLRPWRTLSPSRTKHAWPSSISRFSSA